MRVAEGFVGGACGEELTKVAAAVGVGPAGGASKGGPYLRGGRRCLKAECLVGVAHGGDDVAWRSVSVTRGATTGHGTHAGARGDAAG